MGLLGKSKKQVFGIDISSTSVKLLELKLKGNKLSVESYGVYPLPEEAVVDKAITDVEAVGNAIKEVVAKSKTKAKDASVMISGASVIAKVIQVDSNLSGSKLEEAVKLEAESHVPYPLDEVKLDFEVIGENIDNPDLTDVYLVACQNEEVDKLKEALKFAEIEPAFIDVDAKVMASSCSFLLSQLPDLQEDEAIAVVDIGATTTQLNVLQHGSIIYSRDQSFGGKQLTEEIMRRFGMSYEEAGRAKKEGGLPDNYVLDVLEPFKESMAQQVNRSLQFFYSSCPNVKIGRILLAGGNASISEVDEIIQSFTDIETIVVNPFSNMSVSKKINTHNLSSDAPAMLVVCGLALRGVV